MLLLLTACCVCAAAETEYALTACSGKMSLDENAYIVLTPDNLADHPDLLSTLDKKQDEILADWKERGVVLQAWVKNKNKKIDTCLEVSVVQDDESRQYYDLEQQTRQVRNEYLKAHKNSQKYIDQGYSIMKLEWKKQKLGGNFLKYEYKRTLPMRSYHGIVRKTVRNGYTILLDYQTYDRLPRGTDENNLNKIANTVEFEQIAPPSVDSTTTSSSSEGGETQVSSASASGLLNVTVPPPAEANTETLTVEGQTTPGAHIIGVLMRWSSSTPLKFTTDATRAGNFKLKVTLPEEGVWLLTLNLEINGSIVAEEIFNTTTYSKTMLPVKMDAEIPEQLTSNELVISGVTSKGVTVQCIVTNGSTTFDKTILTNGTGKFKFKVSSAAEGDYDITLAFSKKHYNSNRLTFTTHRSLTAEDTRDKQTTSAIHPSYAALTKKLDTYIGKTFVYNVYIVDIQQIDEEWVVMGALRKTKNGYGDLVVFMADEDPGLQANDKVKLYGTCVGAYQVQSEEENTTYPGFDYLFKD